MCLDHTYFEAKKLKTFLPKKFRPKRGNGKHFNQNTFRKDTHEIVSEE